MKKWCVFHILFLKQSVVTNGSVKIAPFDVRPSILELMKGDTGVLEVVFAPQSVRSYTQEITIVCDNCHVKHFTLRGQCTLCIIHNIKTVVWCNGVARASTNLWVFFKVHTSICRIIFLFNSFKNIVAFKDSEEVVFITVALEV